MTTQDQLQSIPSPVMMVIKRKRTQRPRSRPSSCSGEDSTPTPASSADWDHDQPTHSTEEEQDMANCLILLAQGNKHNSLIPNCSYECKTCNRSFPSFQALGGHRASHKKPKNLDPLPLDYNYRPLSEESSGLSLQIGRKAKIHECAVCGAEFSSGQALGGHMRRHRPLASSSGNQETEKKTTTTRNVFLVDLNLPAPEDDQQQQLEEQQQQQQSKFVFAANGKTLVFSAPSLVDCHY